MVDLVRTLNEAKAIRQRLRRSKARLDATTNLAGLSLYTWDPETGALDWDIKLKSMWGLPAAAEVDHDVWLSGIHPLDRARVQSALKRCTDPAGDGAYHVEYRVIGIGDGVERWVSTHGRMRFKNGRPFSFVGAACEITERKQTEAALRESEIRLAATLEQLPVAVGLFNMEGVRILSNNALKDYSLQSIRSQDPASLARWRAYDQNGTVIKFTEYPGPRALRGESAIPGTDFIFLNADGLERWTKVSAAPFLNSSQEIVGAVVVIQDVDAEKRVEERLREFADNSIDVLWVADPNGRIEYVSSAYEAVFGTAREGLVGKLAMLTEAVDPDHRNVVLDAMDKVRDGRAIVEEFRILRADGAVRWIRNTFFPIRDGQGRFRRIGGIARDITRYDERFVYLIGFEDHSRADLSRMLQDARYEVRAFHTSERFLAVAPVLRPGCVLINIETLGSSALRLPLRLRLHAESFSVIALGGAAANTCLAVQMMKAGAADFLEFPQSHGQVCAAIASALAGLHTRDEHARKAEQARCRLAELTDRERDVFVGLLAGKTNKEIGRDFGISPRTVESHRASVMQRLGVQTLPEAVLMAAAAGFQSPRSNPKSSLP
jgi:PAS domain S-box-containing protein